jgi:hypothetical protein
MNRPAYKRNMEVVERYKAFYASSRPGLMVRVAMPPPRMKRRPRPLNALDWTSEESCRSYARAMLDYLRGYWAVAPVVDDDDLRKVQNLAGTGVIAASYVKDAVVTQETDTNYLEQPVRDWSRDAGRIGFDPENPWYQAQMWMLREYVEQWDGSYGVTPFTHFDPLDLANQWRGNDLFYDYYDHPVELRALLEKATESVLALEAHMRATHMRGYEFPGCFMGCWVPGDYLSCDAGDLSSREALAEWGVPYTQRIVQAWGGAFLHHHELGLHQIETWSRCAGLTIQFPNRDPNTEHMANVITEAMLESSFRVALGFIATSEEFLRNAARYATGKCVVTVICEDPAQAERVVRTARARRNF